MLAMTPDHATALYHINQSMAAAIGNEIINQLFGSGGSRPQWPVLDELIHALTQVLSLPVSMNDEASLKGTYAVHEDVWLRFLKFCREDFKAEKSGRLWLIHGDQMTIERARSVMKEMVESELSFDKKDWMLPIPAWFHIKMNNLWTVAMRTHYDLNKDGDVLDHGLKADNKYFGIKKITNKNPKFFNTQSLVVRGFKACVLGMFVQELKDRQDCTFVRRGDESDLDAIRRSVSDMGKTKYLEVLESIYQKAFTAKAWKGTDATAEDPTFIKDPVFTTQARMMQEVELFMTIGKATRMEDIGHMRRLVDRLIIQFLGAGQSNYGREMIYLRWLLSEAVDEELQTGILASSVLNQSGHRSKAVATDELVEIYNMEYSMDIKQHANSTHTLDKTFRRIALMRECTRVLKLIFGGLGATYTNYHTAKNTSDDIIGYGMQLQEKGLSSIKARTGALSEDIRQAGVELLLSKVGNFNTENRRFARGITTVSPNFDDGEPEDFGQHSEAAAEDGDEAFIAAGGGGEDEIEEEIGEDDWEDVADDGAVGGMSSAF
ncbi:unnamed protein product [Zymoseptoria tritici ST99CH_1E4]|uniref:DUF6589 domain-containing protein n=1 Tax=Zymoseptoria tritici ST99CH_1E4 TaxID=1276532 RepID=A0A2H1H9K8_ZYMTR|nr:unnamed protein product [Zymoseptoria tritici ST99CH_1E4]